MVSFTARIIPTSHFAGVVAVTVLSVITVSIHNTFIFADPQFTGLIVLYYKTKTKY